MGLLNFVVPKYYLHGNKSYGIAQAKENNITIESVALMEILLNV
jgi:hypothetical protein